MIQHKHNTMECFGVRAKKNFYGVTWPDEQTWSGILISRHVNIFILAIYVNYVRNEHLKINRRVPERYERLKIRGISQPTTKTNFSGPFALLALSQLQPISNYIIPWILP